MTPARSVVLRTVAARIPAAAGGVVRVGIDGVDGAGKTTFADELAEVVAAPGRRVIRATVDAFHNPRSVRYRRGRDSPDGFFRDSYDYETLKRVLLDPLSPGGDRRYRTAAFDWRTDAPVHAGVQIAEAGSVLLVDGIFLHRPEIRDYWDYSVFLESWERVHRARVAGAVREGGGVLAVLSWWSHEHRYGDGQRLYLEECRPRERASLVIDNNDFEAPFVLEEA